MRWQLISKKSQNGQRGYLDSYKIIIVSIIIVIFSLNVFSIEHIVQKGENLSSIAKQYNVALGEVLAINGISDANKINIGQKIIIPTKHYVIDLDSLFGEENAERYLQIGRQSRLNVDSYLLVSYLASPIGFEGEEIVHKVKSGETIPNLARTYGVKEEQILSRNGLDHNALLIPDQIVFIPSQTFRMIFAVNKELELLARIIAAEARGESLEGQIAVGAVILNRVKDPRFPNTITEVVFQKNQFEVVSTGVYLTVPVPELSKRAAQEALRGRDPTGGALFFYNPKLVSNARYFESRTKAIEIGNHLFTY